jgi:hypothetical protein
VPQEARMLILIQPSGTPDADALDVESDETS